MACANVRCLSCGDRATPGADAAAFVRERRERIANEAHTLKGAAATVGLRQVAELAKTLELSAFTISPADYGNLVDRLDVCFQRARDETERPSRWP